MSDLTSYYNDCVDDLMESATLPQFDYTPAAVTKSNSLMSNECPTSRSSFDESRPLKLVLKRQSGNMYEIKNESFTDENNNVLTGFAHDQHNQLSNDAWSTSDTPTELENVKRRPTRQSARKVKFIFSDEEDIDQLMPPVKKKRSRSTTHPKQLNNIQMMMPQQVFTPNFIDNGDSDGEDLTNQMYQELLMKNMPQMLNIQNMVLQNQLQNQFLLNAKINNNGVNNSAPRLPRPGKSKPKTVPKKSIKTKSKSPVIHKHETKPHLKHRTNSNSHAPIAAVTVVKPAAPEIDPTFNSDEIIRASFVEKAAIMQRPLFVVLHHSQGIPIALVENKTNFVQTKAVLFIHLFVSLTAGCIWCPLCALHLSVTEFSKHVHPEEGEDEEDLLDELSRTKKTYKVLPYRIDNEELGPNVLNTWKTFAKRYSEFKQAQNKKEAERKKVEEKEIEKKEVEKVLVSRDMNTTAGMNNLTKPLAPVEKSAQRLSEEFEDWDSKENERFLISNERLESDQVCEVKEARPGGDLNETCEQVHYFMEQKEDLLLSEDESDDRSDNSQNYKKQARLSKHLTETSTNQQQASQAIQEPHTAPIQPIVSEILNSVVHSIELQNVKEHLLEKKLSYNEHLDVSSGVKPSLLERYFNLYDNLKADMLLYICDNQFTVIPDSYVMYINYKRAMNAARVKLADTDYYQKEWLQMSLDLECTRARNH